MFSSFLPRSCPNFIFSSLWREKKLTHILLATTAELGRVRRVRPHPRKNHIPISLLHFHHVKLIFHGCYEGSAPPLHSSLAPPNHCKKLAEVDLSSPFSQRGITTVHKVHTCMVQAVQGIDAQIERAHRSIMTIISLLAFRCFGVSGYTCAARSGVGQW